MARAWKTHIDMEHIDPAQLLYIPINFGCYCEKWANEFSLRVTRTSRANPMVRAKFFSRVVFHET